MYRLIILLCFLFFISNLNAQTKVPWVLEQTQACDKGTTQDPTSITTYKDAIYVVYVNTNRQMVVTKKKGKKVEREIVFDLEMGPEERWHICPTLGVDKEGYIHICGDMHNGSWKYFRSDKPEDIKSWTRITNLPGEGITYPTIFYDNNQEMFLLFRHREGNQKGNHRAGVARYNVAKKTYELLGGTNYNEKNGQAAKIKTMVWGNGYGGHNCWYTKPGHRIYFDQNNRMHLISALINVCLPAPLGYESNTVIIYAYSDNLGKTWHKVTGEVIKSLPLTPSNASVVIERIKEHDIYGGESELGAFDSDHPVISYKLSSDNSDHSVMWNGDEWIEISPPHPTNVLVSGFKGYLAWYNGKYIDFTMDGKNWKTIKGETSFPGGSLGAYGSIDRAYFKNSGNLRYHGKFKNFTKSSVITIFSGKELKF